ncbi:MAG: ATP-dependent DNA ligase [Actinomycetales bacterium]|nr:ATP-dependent DNA ligase [Actinomycetales bacterium]
MSALEVGRVTMRHPDKVMYPSTGTTKGELVEYLRAVAAPLLAQLRDRPVTRVRLPDGMGGERFFEKNVPRGAPAWLRHQTLRAAPGGPDEGKTLELPFLDELDSLVWALNLGALELHTPQWRVGPRGGVRGPDRFVVDLDPGPPAGLAECAHVARLVAERLRADGLAPVPVTSGSKGIQLYAPLAGDVDVMRVHAYGRELARSLAAEHPELILATSSREERTGRVFIDWSQNHPAKTTITPYSLRARELPNVAAPRTWDELDGPDLAQLDYREVARRVEADGDLYPWDAPGGTLPRSA